MNRDTVIGTFTVAALLCVVCSLLVSSAAVGLRPLQVSNRALEKKRNILEAAGLASGRDAAAVDEAFRRIETRVVELATGQYVGTETIDPATYDPVAASRNPELSIAIAQEDDVAAIKRREKYSFVSRVKGESGEIEKVVLPIYGKGLWSTVYGFLAVGVDASTVEGITFYEHGETPGLGGEIENPAWTALWKGKTVFNDSGEVVLEVVKGSVNPESAAADHQVDGLSGATITSKGVSQLVHYWMGPHGFGPFLDLLRQSAGGGTSG